MKKIILPDSDGRRNILIEPDRILCNEVVLPGEPNPANTKLWVVSCEEGYHTIHMGAVWANHEGQTIDLLVDADLADAIILSEEDLRRLESKESDWPTAGNNDVPVDLTYVSFRRIDFVPERDWKILCMFDKATRELVASKWRKEFESEFAAGSYDEYIPKKYRKTAKTNAALSRSIAYLSGKKDAETWIRRTDPRADTLRAYLKQEPGFRTPSEELIQFNPRPKVAKKLGIPAASLKDSSPAYANAIDEYQRGYYDACRRLLDAIEGN